MSSLKNAKRLILSMMIFLYIYYTFKEYVETIKHLKRKSPGLLKSNVKTNQLKDQIELIDNEIRITQMFLRNINDNILNKICDLYSYLYLINFNKKN